MTDVISRPPLNLPDCMMTCSYYGGADSVEEQQPRSAHHAEFECGGAPRVQLCITRTRPAMFTLGRVYGLKIAEAGVDDLRMTEFPAFVLQCSHINQDHTGEHAHLVGEPGLHHMQMTLNFWNVYVGAFRLKGFYCVVIEHGEGRPQPLALPTTQVFIA